MQFQGFTPSSAALSSRELARAFAVTIVLAIVHGNAFAEAAKPEPANPDWPCKQILVEQISLPAVWAGPSIEGVDWRGDEPVADLVAHLAARKTPIEAAEHSIEAFAASAGPDKKAKLVALFAGLFETLNSQRLEIIDGLSRFGRKQKALAAKIRAENAEIQKSPDASRPTGPSVEGNAAAQKLEWDLRLFDEGRVSLSYACEAPTQVEQRLFALSRAIQNNLD
ncbi:conserved hypothetical protein [Methylocella tundrae]|uniref:Uncharacterized protein n=1 Tax=Methylocella tundrae TaxID=227605 RepID=A0A8B6MBQ5_METTU|nr:hypothetical protein [Methylocella tundrae]VTZ28397.1 conserved hypothetical protein [Methylocella tundrae]VTZ52151.1 conserved hypothetical protein [Methylocella tundrae]